MRTCFLTALFLAAAAALLSSALPSQVRASPAPVLTQDMPERRAAEADLAYVLGQAHALRQVCVGADDGGWRSRMERMLDLEAPDPASRRRLTSRFNAGFLAQRAQFPTCSDKVAVAERAVARKGLDLSRRLAGPRP